jgi:predicted murein hydrolase (TIGR00659 family)
MTALYSLVLTLGVYLISQRFYRYTGNVVSSPLIVCPIVLVTLLLLFHVSYDTYNEGGQILSFMLQPATVALAVPIYKYRTLLKKYGWEIFISITSGAALAVVTSMGFASLLGLSPQVIDSLAPRSITTPMAMSISEMLGGNPAMTAVFVIITGIVGVVITPLLFKIPMIQNPVTKGLMLGVGAHGTGTAKAYEIGPLEGAMASLAMTFMGIVTTLLAPQLVPFCFYMLSTM